VAARRGRVLTQGCFWGEDFILDTLALKDRTPSQTLTFCELLVLDRVNFFDVLDFFPNETALVRKATVRMAFKRGILVEADKRIEEKLRQEGKSNFDLSAALMQRVRDGKAQAATIRSSPFKSQKVSVMRLIKEHELKVSSKLAQHEVNVDTKLRHVQGSIERNMGKIAERFETAIREMQQSAPRS
jgi:hypothetical protein